jgi:hypothetical protein
MGVAAVEIAKLPPRGHKIAPSAEVEADADAAAHADADGAAHAPYEGALSPDPVTVADEPGAPSPEPAPRAPDRTPLVREPTARAADPARLPRPTGRIAEPPPAPAGGRAAPAMVPVGAHAAPAMVPTASPEADEPLERSSVMADLRTMAGPAPEPRQVDDDLLRMPSGYFQNGEPAADAAGVAAAQPSQAHSHGDTSQRTAPGLVDLAIVRPSAPAGTSGVERCPHCGEALAMPGLDAARPALGSSPLARVKGLLLRKSVRTYAPWGVAGASLLLAIVAWSRGGGSATTDAAAPSASGEAQAAVQPTASAVAADATGAKPATPPKVSPPTGFKPKPKTAPAKTAPAKTAPAKKPPAKK